MWTDDNKDDADGADDNGVEDDVEDAGVAAEDDGSNCLSQRLVLEQRRRGHCRKYIIVIALQQKQ